MRKEYAAELGRQVLVKSLQQATIITQNCFLASPGAGKRFGSSLFGSDCNEGSSRGSSTGVAVIRPLNTKFAKRHSHLERCFTVDAVSSRRALTQVFKNRPKSQHLER